MKNRRKDFINILLTVLVSYFSMSFSVVMAQKQLDQESEAPTSDLYILKDINNPPLLAQLTKYSKDKATETKTNVKICFYPSSMKVTDSVLLTNGLVFNIGQDVPSIARFSTVVEAISMTKADSLAEIKRFVGTLFKNGDTTKAIKSHKGIVQPRYLLLASFEGTQKNKMAEGSIRAKNKLRERKELVFKKSDAACD